MTATDKKPIITLAEAVKAGKVRATRELLDAGANARRVVPNYERRSLLHEACSRGYTTIVRLLIEHGANVNATDREDTTPLHWACFKGRLDIARLLIEKGADVNAKEKKGITPLHIASEKIIWELVHLLLSHGANVNAKNKSGNTPLHDACRGVPGPRRARRTETIRLLLSHGAPGVKNAKGYTPLGYVTSLPDDHPAREEIIELFREHAPEVVMEAWCTQGTTDIS